MSQDHPSGQELFHFTEPSRVCSYLPTETASLEYVGLGELRPGELEEWVRRGWRRFGMHLFRPACSACQQCVPVRVRVREFQPSRSQRRALARNTDVHVELAAPQVSPQHVQLYNAWHEDMTRRSGWAGQQVDWREYAQGFLSGDFPSLREMRYWSGETLVGIGLIELLPRSLSSVYFFHEPAWRPRGPGTFSLLCEINLAKQLGLEHVYLGYWIARCESMSYKNRFRPQEELLGRPEMDEEPLWRRSEGPQS